MGASKLPMAAPSAGHKVSATAATVAIGAIACGVCCALPFALPAVIIGSAGGLLALLAQAFSWALPVAAALLVGAWLWIGVQTWRTGKRPARTTLVVMLVATAAFVVVAAWLAVEPRVVDAQRQATARGFLVPDAWP